MNRICNEVKFLENFVAQNSLNGLVIGVSGGVDSAVCLGLACNAIGAGSVFAMLMPHAEQEYYSSYCNSVDICNHFGVCFKTVNIEKIVESFGEQDEYHRGNIMARVRMTLLYNEAAIRKYAVVNTCNLSEDVVGYATKFGDAAGDVAPITHLMKHEVYKIAEFLKIPEHLINRIPSAELWNNQTDERELGFTYEELDKVIELFKKEELELLSNDEPIYGYAGMHVWMVPALNHKNYDELGLPVSKSTWKLIHDRNKAAQHKLQPMPNMLN